MWWRLIAIATVTFLGALAGHAADAQRELFGATNGFRVAELGRTGSDVSRIDGRLRVEAAARDAGGVRRSVSFPLEENERDLSRFRHVEIEVENLGSSPVTFTFWALSEEGWGGVSTFSTTQNTSGREVLAPRASATFKIDLHARYSGREVYTKAIDPSSVRRLELVFENDRSPVRVQIEAIRAIGAGPSLPHDTSRRIRVPAVTHGSPVPGFRVYQQLPHWQQTEVRHVIGLPRNWRPGRRWPVIVEYTGNVFYHKYCHSTGRAAQGNLAYGLSRGEDFITLNLPFISPDGRREQVDGWGDICQAIDYCLAALKYVEQNYEGDPTAVIYTGFSRGSYAASYLALRDDRLSPVWAGFLTLHDPGAEWPGSKGRGWRGVDIGWNERAVRLNGRPWFHQPDELGAEVHVDGEFLEDRPSTVATREWIARLLRR